MSQLAWVGILEQEPVQGVLRWNCLFPNSVDGKDVQTCVQSLAFTQLVYVLAESQCCRKSFVGADT